MDIHIPDLFDLQKIADSGQCFRVASLSDGVYRFITGAEVLYIRKVAEETYQVSCSPEVWARIWSPYFDLGRNYRAIGQAIGEEDTFLSLAAQVGAGIRILHQDPWEMLVTFIISQRKSIPAIRSVVEMLCARYGSKIPSSAQPLYTFPTAAQMKEARLEDFVACKAGYRAAYLQDAVQQVLSGNLDLEGISSLPDSELIAALKQVRGVGVKVANCVALFAYGRTGCAPVDTWIQKIIRQKYQGQSPFGQYGASAGIMQQYLFYYAQTHKAQTA